MLNDAPHPPAVLPIIVDPADIEPVEVLAKSATEWGRVHELVLAMHANCSPTFLTMPDTEAKLKTFADPLEAQREALQLRPALKFEEAMNTACTLLDPEASEHTMSKAKSMLQQAEVQWRSSDFCFDEVASETAVCEYDQVAQLRAKIATAFLEIASLREAPSASLVTKRTTTALKDIIGACCRSSLVKASVWSPGESSAGRASYEAMEAAGGFLESLLTADMAEKLNQYELHDLIAKLQGSCPPSKSEKTPKITDKDFSTLIIGSMLSAATSRTSFPSREWGIKIRANQLIRLQPRPRSMSASLRSDSLAWEASRSASHVCALHFSSGGSPT